MGGLSQSPGGLSAASGRFDLRSGWIGPAGVLLQLLCVWRCVIVRKIKILFELCVLSSDVYADDNLEDRRD